MAHGTLSEGAAAHPEELADAENQRQQLLETLATDTTERYLPDIGATQYNPRALPSQSSREGDRMGTRGVNEAAKHHRASARRRRDQQRSHPERSESTF